MTTSELVLAVLIVLQSGAWIVVDFRRFCRDFDRWADRPIAPANNFEDLS